MRYLSVCSGIEAASVAAPEGWHAAAFAEIEPFPSAVLAHRFPTVPNLGDFTKIEAHHVGTIDLLVGGTPCQSFSIAGQRLGLDDPRGNLTLEYLALAGRLKPRWIVWENVPGVLSIDEGRTFGAILGALGQLGYGFAYRVLDAQHFGVPQRRRRVFVVGCADGQWQRAAAVLFEPDSLRGNSAAGGKARQDPSGALGASSGGADDNDAADGRLIAQCVTTGTGRRYDPETETLVSPALDKSKTPAVFDAVQITSKTNRSRVTPGAPAGTVSKNSDMHAIEPLQPFTGPQSGVRRLMPVETERLQGFPDDWTDVPYRNKPAADGPRYKAIGNSMAVPVMRWIFDRIAKADT